MTMANMQRALIRVPEVTLVFWIIKTLSTTVGETGADFLAADLGFGMPIVAVVITTIMAILLYFQFTNIKRYIPANYWTIVVLMSIVGTLITDILVDVIGISMLTLSIVFTVAMLLGFFIWFESEKTLSIHSIDTGKREAYYWIIIILAFALGTAAGDLMAEHLGLGYGLTLLIFISMIAAVTTAYFALNMNGVLAFWLAFILTRPLGASLGDFLTKASNEGGLGIDMLLLNGIFFITIIGLVFYLSTLQKKTLTIK
ncbi:MAG: putative membrane-anchored protein [Oleispira sp.]|jgi:uncharacterized membrane-anchored protein